MGIMIRIDVKEKEQLSFKVWNDSSSDPTDSCQSKILANFDVAINKEAGGKETNVIEEKETDIIVQKVQDKTTRTEANKLKDVANTDRGIALLSVSSTAVEVNNENDEDSLEEYFIIDKIVGNRFNPLTKQHEFLLKVRDCQPVNNVWKPIPESRTNLLPGDARLFIQKTKSLQPLKRKVGSVDSDTNSYEGNQAVSWSKEKNLQPETLMNTETNWSNRNPEKTPYESSPNVGETDERFYEEVSSNNLTPNEDFTNSIQDVNSISIKCEPEMDIDDGKDYDYEPMNSVNCNVDVVQRSIQENASYVDSSIPNPFTCNLCGRTFSGIQYLRKHEKIHTKSTIFNCSVCNFAFSNLHLLSVHERNTHGIRRIPRPRGAPPGPRKRLIEPPVQIPFLHHLEPQSSPTNVSTFVKEYEPEMLEMSSSDKPFKCQLCIRSFRNQHALTLHEGVHNDGRLFTCSVCDRVFTYLHALKNHERTHLNLKPVPCCYCGKLFTMESRRKLHERKHRIDLKNQRLPNMIPVSKSQEDHDKPFFCRYCPKAFRLKHTLIVHTRTHTGEKPFACHLCDYRSSQKISLDVHMRKHEKSWMQNATY